MRTNKQTQGSFYGSYGLLLVLLIVLLAYADNSGLSPTKFIRLSESNNKTLEQSHINTLYR
jgi:hypothetical protein